MGDELFTICDRTKTKHCLSPVCIISVSQILLKTVLFYRIINIASLLYAYFHMQYFDDWLLIQEGQHLLTGQCAAALWGEVCATHVLPMGVGPFAFRYQGNRATPANVLIPLERQLIALQFCHWQFLYNETLQQTSRPLLSKLSEKWQI